MYELPHPVADGSDATDARFSLRAVLKIMAVVAVAAAVLGPVVRQLDADSQRRLLTAWGLWLAGAVMWIGSQARLRFELERLAGPTIIRLPMFDARLAGMTAASRFLNGVRALLSPVLGLLLFSMMALRPPNATSRVLTVLLFISCAVASIGLLCHGVFRLWWQRSVRVCESGVLWDRTLLYWTHLIGHRWSDAVTLHLHGTDQNSAETEIEVPVPPERRDAVEQLLEANAAHRPSVSAVDAGTGQAANGGAGAQRMPRKSVAVAIRILLAVGVFYVFASGFRGTSEFYDMMIAGMLGGGMLQALRGARISNRAGAPLARLDGRIGSLESLALFAVCVASYSIGTSFIDMGTWLAFITGLVCGLTFVLALFPGELACFELREDGVFYPGRYLWPWSSVRLIRWDAGGTGRLVLGRGWRKIVARVPAEQRSAVDEVLAQKLGLPAGVRASEAPN